MSALVSKNWLKALESFVSDIRITSKEVVTDDPRGAPLVLWESQKRALRFIGQGLDEGIHDFNILKSRQLGITTITLAIDLFWAAMHSHLYGCIVTENEKNREKNRAMLANYCNSFPDGYFGDEFRIVTNNRNFIEFSNKSRYDFLVAGTKKKSSTSWAEGSGYMYGHLTEIAAYGDPEGLESLEESFAQTNPHRLFIKESTAKGFAGPWYSRYKAGESDGLTKRSTFLGWWSGDTNRVERKDPRFAMFGLEPPDRDERELIHQVATLYDHRITPEQLAWVRWKSSNPSSDDTMLLQNQPWCVVGETRVGTDCGILKIEDVRLGMKTALGEVVASHQKGEAPIWVARTHMGYEIRGTSNHPLIDIEAREVPIEDSMGTWVRLQPPKFADEIYTVKWREGVTAMSVDITPDFARLVGLFMGDGSVSLGKKGGPQFAIACDSKDQDIIAECQRLIRTLFGVEPSLSVYREVGDGGWTNVRSGAKIVAETFKKLGLTRSENGASMLRHVHVPDFIWRSPKHVVREFLSGVFEADGFNAYDTCRTSIASKYGTFIADIHLLLLGFGITGKYRHHQPKIRTTGKVYHATQLELRAEEAIKFNQEIGFISERKRNRHAGWRPVGEGKKHGANRLRIAMRDKIVSVERTKDVRPVYNLTITDPHWFDANGIVTHNTAAQAFQTSGFSFFQSRKIGETMKQIMEDESGEFLFQAYRYEFGNTFFDVKLIALDPEAGDTLDQAQLRVWEEPHPQGRYAIGMDPAYGRTDHGDKSCIQVFRCYADRLVQVAEFACNQTLVKQAAWVLAHLAGAYKNCIVNVELNGPGQLVMPEWDSILGQIQAEMYRDTAAPRDWENAMANARWYLYHKPDSMGAGYAYNTMASWKDQIRSMHSLKGALATGELLIRSLPLLKEMNNVVQDGQHIGAPDSSSDDCKDDLVFATGLAHLAWFDWVKKDMISQGMTYEKVRDEEAGITVPTVRSMNSIVSNFFKTREEAAMEPDFRPRWKVERGLE